MTVKEYRIDYRKNKFEIEPKVYFLTATSLDDALDKFRRDVREGIIETVWVAKMYRTDTSKVIAE